MARTCNLRHDVTSKLKGNDMFTYRYSSVYDGYFIAFTMDAKKLFAEMPRAKVKITIDLNSEYLAEKEINIVGFDYDAFNSVEIDTLTIIGSKQTLYLLDKALWDTQLQTLKYSKGITLDNLSNVINNEYVEVIVCE